jgi:soluble lytic murein transglycosylase
MRRILVSFVLIIICLFTISYSKEILKTGFPEKYGDIVKEEAKKYGMDEYLIYSVMRAESRYDRLALSYAGAKGLMQVTDATFDMIRGRIDIDADIYDAGVNIEAGVWYLADLYDMLGDIRDTVRAYNCGPDNLDAKIVQTDIFEERVFEFYDIYVYLYGD